jgi:hypothetical protein
MYTYTPNCNSLNYVPAIVCERYISSHEKNLMKLIGSPLHTHTLPFGLSFCILIYLFCYYKFFLSVFLAFWLLDIWAHPSKLIKYNAKICSEWPSTTYMYWKCSFCIRVHFIFLVYPYYLVAGLGWYLEWAESSYS